MKKIFVLILLAFLGSCIMRYPNKQRYTQDVGSDQNTSQIESTEIPLTQNETNDSEQVIEIESQDQTFENDIQSEESQQEMDTVVETEPISIDNQDLEQMDQNDNIEMEEVPTEEEIIYTDQAPEQEDQNLTYQVVTEEYQHSKISLAELPLLVDVMHIWNKLINEKNKLVPSPVIENEVEIMNVGLNRYESVKRIVEIFTLRSQDLIEELNLLYGNIDVLEMNEVEMLNLFGVYDYFASSMSQLDPRDPVIYDVEKELETLFLEFINRAKGFISSIQATRFLDDLIYRISEPYASQIQGEENFDLLTKLDTGISLVNIALEIKKALDNLEEDLKIGLVFVREFKQKILDLVHKLDPNWQTPYSGGKIDEFKEAYCDKEPQ